LQTNDVTLQLPYPPSVNRIWRNARGIIYKTDAARDYRYFVVSEANRVSLPLLTGAVALTVHLFPPQSNCDIDNALKVLSDALQGIAYHDDKQVVELHVYKAQGRGSRKTARALVQVQPVGGRA
jgi:crossover junction endodeoxyribonuclease RusA